VYLFLLRDIKNKPYRKANQGNPYLSEEEVTYVEIETPHVETWDGSASRKKAEWWSIRKQVLARDNFKCTKCGSTEKLEIHHKRSKGGNGLDNLETLCQKCHEETPTYGWKKLLLNGKKTQWRAG